MSDHPCWMNSVKRVELTAAQYLEKVGVWRCSTINSLKMPCHFRGQFIATERFMQFFLLGQLLRFKIFQLRILMLLLLLAATRRRAPTAPKILSEPRQI